MRFGLVGTAGTGRSATTQSVTTLPSDNDSQIQPFVYSIGDALRRIAFFFGTLLLTSILMSSIPETLGDSSCNVD